MIKTKSIQDSLRLSFEDTYGATVIVPNGTARDYAGTKSEQLRAITQLLSMAVTGSITLPGSLHEIFQVTANGLAHELEQIVGLVSIDAANVK